MAKKFNFSKDLLKLDFEGLKIEVDANKVNLIGALEDNSAQLKEITEAVDAGKITDNDDVSQTITTLRKMIDDLIGEGSADKIMDGRDRYNLGLYLEVLYYITGEIVERRNQSLGRRYDRPTAGKERKQ